MPWREKAHEADPNGVRDFWHAEARRKNNPPAGIAPTYESRERQIRQYAYDPHLDPQLVCGQSRAHLVRGGRVSLRIPLHAKR